MRKEEQRKKTVQLPRRKFSLSVRMLNIIVIVLICLAGMGYVAKINSISIKGFKMKEIEERQAALKEKIKKGEFQAAELQSMQKVQERIGGLGMVGVASVEYASSGGAVAIK